MPTRTDKAAEAASDSLPAYTEAPPYTEAGPPAAPSRSSRPSATTTPEPEAPPPDYRQASLTPYVAIPTTLHGVSRAARRGLHLCADADGRERLFYAVHHTGLSGGGPLGSRPGVHLHNGLDAKAPVLAAAGHRSQALTMHESLRDLTSVVLLPPAAPAAGRRHATGYANVVMEPLTMSDGAATAAAAAGPVFRLKFDVGSGPADKHRPAKFAWCRPDGKDAGGSGGGGGGSSTFQLIRKVFRHGEHQFTAATTAEDGDPATCRCEFPKTEEELAAGESLAGDDGEVVAVLTCGAALKPWGRLFTLELRGSAAAGLLGERCAVMIATTALRLHQMHTQGKTNRTFLGLVGSDGQRRAKTASGGRKSDTVREVIDSVTLLTVLL